MSSENPVSEVNPVSAPEVESTPEPVADPTPEPVAPVDTAPAEPVAPEPVAPEPEAPATPEPEEDAFETEVRSKIFEHAMRCQNRRTMFQDALHALENKLDGVDGSTTLDPHAEFTAFAAPVLYPGWFLNYALDGLKARFTAIRDGEQSEDREVLIALASNATILYCKRDENELVRDFLPILFAFTQSSGKIPEGMSAASAKLYVSFACNNACRFIDAYLRA